MIERIQKAILEERLDGWLFYNFRNRDRLALRILQIPDAAISTRGWCYFIPARGTPAKILHRIESSALDHLPGTSFLYSTQKELHACLQRFSGLKVAVQYSPEIAIISYLDHGMALNLEQAGLRLVPSAGLIQRIESLLGRRMIQSHEAAAKHLYEIVETVWEKIRSSFPGAALKEGDLQTWIMDEFSKRGLETDHPPIVAAGVHSANPHYAPQGGGARLQTGEVLQLDLWAKQPGGVYADISWVGILAPEIPPEVERVFSAVVCARDGCIDFINSRLSRNEPVEGREADAHARGVIEERGFGRFITHRTGHSIDIESHGSGVNLDAIEFPDSRQILNGACFSVEPGIYLREFGLRTEINAYIANNKAVVSGGEPQNRVLTLID